jgi:hypothetical protein
MTAFIRQRNRTLGEVAMGTGKQGARYARTFAIAIFAFWVCGAVTALADHLSTSGASGQLKPAAALLPRVATASTNSSDPFQAVLTRLQLAAQKSQTGATINKVPLATSSGVSSSLAVASSGSGTPVPRATGNNSILGWNVSNVSVRQMVLSPYNTAQRFVKGPPSIFNSGPSSGNFNIATTGSAVGQATGGTAPILSALPFGVGLDSTTTGPKTGTVKISNISNPLDVGGNKTLTISGSVVDNRVINASTANFGNVLLNGGATAVTNLGTSGTSDYFTSVKVATSTGQDSNGVQVAGGADTIFNTASSISSRTLAGTFTNPGAISSTIGSIPIISTENLLGEHPGTVSVHYQANVGWATAQSTASRAAFGPALTGSFSGATPYRTLNAASDVLTNGLYSKETALTGSGGLAMAGGNNSEASILDLGPTPGTGAVSMAWRTRAPGPAAGNESSLISDVVNVTAPVLTGGLTGVDGRQQTQPYVIAMKYSAPQLLASTGKTDTQWLAMGMDIGMVYLDKGADATANTGDDDWKFAWEGCFNSPLTGGNQFVLGAYNPADDFTVGTWGIDTTNDVAWAVVNFNGQFGVAPEPTTWVMLLSGGLLGGFGAYRRRKSKASAAS